MASAGVSGGQAGEDARPATGPADATAGPPGGAGSGSGGETASPAGPADAGGTGTTGATGAIGAIGAGPVLVLEHAAKSFGAVQALLDGSIELYPGQAHALVGENGAGKSTLVKILAGVYQPDAGSLLVNLRQTAGLAVPLVAVSVLLAACSSSSSSSSSGPATGATSSSSASSSSGAGGLKTGMKVFVIPKNLGNNYFTTADSANSGGAIAALQALGETGTETSGTAATPASQIPAIQAAISKGANALIVSATDPTALCPTLNAAMKRGITVVTYDSDAPGCRNLFINQASTAQIGTSEVDVLAKELNDTGDIAIVSATASATNRTPGSGT
jgi:energy-coupling factor transporter ATP-binding protein EcfA2